MLTNFKNSLGAFSLRDIQNFSYFITILEQGYIPLPIARQAINDVISKTRREMKVSDPASRKEYRRLTKNKPSPVIDSGPCPDCGKHTFIIYADQVLIKACQSCRWSALVGE